MPLPASARRTSLRAGALALILGLGAAAVPVRHRGFGPFGRPVLEPFMVQDMLAVLSGSRRLGADLAFIQLLLYYGSPGEKPAASPKDGHEGHDPEDDAPPGHAHGLGRETGIVESRLPEFPRLKDHGFRVGALDPYFHYALVFTGGALGFNLNRADEAIEVLRRGMELDPRFPRYSLLIGALAYRDAEEIDRVVPWLEEAIKDPDCPTMLKNILANMHRKKGRVRRAAEIFLDILDHSRDRDYADLARQNLEEIERELAGRR